MFVGERGPMSDFAIKREQRERLLAGQYQPLKFLGPTDPELKDPLPYGCRVGARYVLAWAKASATVIDEDEGLVSRIPRHPTWFITVTAVEGGPRKPRELADRPWVVRFSVTDIRDSDVFLRPGGGDSSVDVLRAGAKPDAQWLKTRAKAVGEFWHAERLKRHAERERNRFRAKRLRRFPRESNGDEQAA